MATQVVTTLLDDLDGSEAEDTIRFELDGKAFEIDLSAAHAGELRRVFAPYIEKGRRLTTKTARPYRRTHVAGSDKTTNKEYRDKVRQWAAGHGWPELKGRRGRIPQEVYDAYERARALPSTSREARVSLSQLGTVAVEEYGGEGTPKTVQFRPPHAG